MVPISIFCDLTLLREGLPGLNCRRNVDSCYICRSFSENVPSPVEALTAHTIPFSGLKDGTHDFDFVLGDEFLRSTGVEAFLGGELKAPVPEKEN